MLGTLKIVFSCLCYVYPTIRTNQILIFASTQAFGFCEYSNPDAGLRAIRLLHNWTIADKTLVVKVDAKTQKVLDGYKADRLKKMNGGKSPHVDETTGEDYLDDDMKYEDGLARDRIAQILQVRI